jgi:2-keto-4-pentenoate hydratase/2-oxohepta-3-ene-1,7-dioic acid hydratase in catechol pathway
VGEMKPGDVVEVKVEGVGTLRNTVVPPAGGEREKSRSPSG